MKVSAIELCLCIGLLFVPWLDCCPECPAACNCSWHNSSVVVSCQIIEVHQTVANLPNDTTHLLLKQLPEKPHSDNKKDLALNFSHALQVRVVLLDADFMGYVRSYHIGPSSFADNSSITKFSSRLPLKMDSDALAPLSHLEELTLSSTALQWEDFPMIMKQSLCNLNKLQKLVLHRFSKEYGSSPYQSMFNISQIFTYCRLTSLQFLDLSGNDIFRISGNMYAVFPNLRVLDLSHNMLFTTRYMWSGIHYSALISFFFFLNLHTFDIGSQMDRNMLESEWTIKDLFKNANIPSLAMKCDIIRNVFELIKLFLSFRVRFGDLVYSKGLCSSIERLVVKDVTHYNNIWNVLPLEVNLSVPFNNVRYMDVSMNHIPWFHTEKNQIKYIGLDKLEYVNGQGLGLLKLNILPVEQIPSLQYFLLGKNNLGSFFLSNKTYPFKELKKLKVIDLAENGINSIPSDIFVDCPQLAQLNLSRNNIAHINIDLNGTVELQVFNLSNNLLETLSLPMYQNLHQLASAQKRPLILDLNRNPLSCGCHNLQFVSWLQSTRVRIYQFETLTCSHPFYGATEVRTIKVEELHEQCFPSQWKTIVVSVSVTVGTILIFAIPLLLYCKRWKVRYWWYITNSSWRRIRQEEDTTSWKYDAFVACHHSDLQWVRHHLLVQMEEILQFKFCVYHRDFIQGRNTAEEIIEGIDSSRRTILVLSPQFVESEWCQFEINMAMNQLFDSGRDVILPVILKSLDSKSINRTLYSILKKKLYMEWDDQDLDAQKLFWFKLNEALTSN